MGSKRRILETGNCGNYYNVKGRKAGYLNKKADLMEKMVRKVQIRASQRAWL